MKPLFFTIATLLTISVSSLKAQNKATLDNNQFVAVTQTQATTGKNNPVHYKLTNNNSVSMDFSLYKEMKNGSWDVVHHLDLAPGQSYEDVSGFTGYTGKYAVFSAPHSQWASFPNQSEIAGLQVGTTSTPAAPPTTTTTPGTTATSTTTPATTTAPATGTPSVTTTTPASVPPADYNPTKPTTPRP